MAKWWLLVAIACGCGSVSNKTPDARMADAATGASIALAKPSRWVPQGSSVSVAFTITRTTSMGALTVHVAGLPAGVTAADVDVAAGGTSGMLSLTATGAATLGSSTDVMVELHDGAQTVDTKTFTVKISGAPGTLDATFGTAGRRIVSLPDPVQAGVTGNAGVRAVLQYPPSAGANAGKLLVIGQDETTGSTSPNMRRIAVARLNADGTPDTAFGAGLGYVLINPGDTHGLYATGAALDSQNRILVQASVQDTNDVCTVYITRLTPDGATDAGFTTFNTFQPGGYCGHPEGLTVLPGDKVLSVNQWNNPDGSQLKGLMQLNSDGSMDNTAFPGNTYAIRVGAVATGKTMMYSPGGPVRDAQGNILLTGAECAGGWNTAYSACESVVARMTPTGAWDTTYGTGGTGHLGYTSLTFGGATSSTYESFYGSALDASGNLYTVGYNTGETINTMAKLKPTGELDTTFGNSGRLTPSLINGTTDAGFYNVMIDEDGKLVVVGYAVNGGSLLVNARFDATGAIDTSYGTSGFSTTPTAPIVWHSLLQSDGRLVVAGYYPRTGGGYEMAVWRYWP